MWRFVQLSDPHLGSTQDVRSNNVLICSLMPEVIGCLRRDLEELAPDFIITTGDIVHEPTRDALFAARDLMDSLPFRHYPAGGDTDFREEASRGWFIEAFQADLPSCDTVYSFTHKGLHVCVLDPWWVWDDGTLCPYVVDLAQGRGWAVPPHQLAWLKDDLDSNKDLPTVVALHYPAIQVPAPTKWRRPGAAGTLQNGDLLKGLLAAHPQVKLVLAGHAHRHHIADEDGLTHVVTGALTEYPVEYRDIRVYADRIEVHTLGLSEDEFAARSLVQGGEWTGGEERDRRVVIPL